MILRGRTLTIISEQNVFFIMFVMIIITTAFARPDLDQVACLHVCGIFLDPTQLKVKNHFRFNDGWRSLPDGKKYQYFSITHHPKLIFLSL